jgi:ATP-dependent helicase YprA (DUF1998 family)
MTSLTLGETSQALLSALCDHIEATYHIGDERLVQMRRRLLGEPGLVFQEPYIESTPRYVQGPRFEDLPLPDAAIDLLLTASRATHDGNPLIHNPPYQHQADSLVEILNRRRSTIVTTGTGSGKTECFLLPILGHLAQQAMDREVFAPPAVRALLLYPMNALVNDQLGRLRVLFGHVDVAGWFQETGGRPARFARYTSRTLYPGVRTRKKDQQNLRPLGKYYVDTAREAASPTGDQKAKTLVRELSRRGKWPSKPDLLTWFGPDNSRWQDARGQFVRCVTMPEDPELLTRHEVLAAPPDVLITNYSMLEYMLMRPLERAVFDRTRAWLEANPEETFLIVVDEAHLYRGSSGAEVGLLIRRLRDRLGIPAARLQVICTTASFADSQAAPSFAASLTGVSIDSVSLVAGPLALREGASAADAGDAERFAKLDTDKFLLGSDPEKRAALRELMPNIPEMVGDPRIAAYIALQDHPAMSLLVNLTMQKAQPVAELSRTIFPGASDADSARATATLVALGSFARAPDALDGPGLLPSRLHAFFRGLPGLWVCLDPACPEVASDERSPKAGRMFGQPTFRCECGARAMELFTCRSCGAAYARAYVDTIENPQFLWSLPGEEFASASGSVPALEALDLLLESPVVSTSSRPAQLDLVTGRLNTKLEGKRTRMVFLPPFDLSREDAGGAFIPCGVCGQSASFGRSSVQDHQTEGDQPFQALVARQVEVQQPSFAPSEFAPMGGRKVLVFSDSRQVAARLAPNLQRYTTQDAVRPAILRGFQLLTTNPVLAALLSLDDAYLAVLVGSADLGVRLRPPTRLGDSFEDDFRRVSALRDAPLETRDTSLLQAAFDMRSQVPPESLLEIMHSIINDQWYGLRSLALATVEGKRRDFADTLPAISDSVASVDDKRAFVDLWLGMWRGAWLHGTPQVWLDSTLKPNSGRFPQRLRHTIDRSGRKIFDRDWLPLLLAEYTERIGVLHRLRATQVVLRTGGPWGYCEVCRATQRPLPGRPSLCSSCGQSRLRQIDPDADPVFAARKGYFRNASALALSHQRQPVALVAAEHTAQLNDAQADAVFSEAEENELLFQDVDLGLRKSAVDVLSCTTTMEVGIDIGALSGVALRNMPPARANYQQRAGRAGRRGRAVATVVAFASSESHDEHGFGEPSSLIRGLVVDPEMALDNWHIAQRHLRAFVLQEYLQTRIPIDASSELLGGQLFNVLGSVASFSSRESLLNQFDFEEWVNARADDLAARLRGWLPTQLQDSDSVPALKGRVLETVEAIRSAIEAQPGLDQRGISGDAELSELTPETEDAAPDDPDGAETLLGRLLYRGVLPRYAFPTDVASFHVFDAQGSKSFRPVFRYSPSQALAAALSQYAPGKRIWIGSREWTSGAIYSRFSGDRFSAWQSRKVYSECSVCHYSVTDPVSALSRNEVRACPACGTAETLGPSQTWLRPPGFAHPHYLAENTSPRDTPPPSYATHARLTAPTPADPHKWAPVTARISSHFDRMQLLVTNRGPKNEGYSYCTKCGLIEAATTQTSDLDSNHRKPYPDDREPICVGGHVARSIVLGTDFLSDVLLISLRVDQPLTLQPGVESTRVALRTLAEALTLKSAHLLGIGPAEVQAEFRPALTAGGHAGLEAEIYIYDTLAGGAGYARRIGELGADLFVEALDLLTNCPASCDASCYRCLRGYKNKFEHHLLDRHIGASLLRYLLTSEPLTVDPVRAARSIEVLSEDLMGLGLDDLEVSVGGAMEVPGFGRLTAPLVVSRAGGPPTVVLLDHPVAPGFPLNSEWVEPSDYAVSPAIVHVDELVVRRNLPFATLGVLSSLGYPR